MHLPRPRPLAPLVMPALAGVMMTAMPLATASEGAPPKSVTPTSADTHAVPYDELGEAHLTLAKPLPASRAIDLASRATPEAPLELLFESGEWTGGIVVTDHSQASLAVVRKFVGSSPAAQAAAPITSINAARETFGTGVLDDLPGTVARRPAVTESTAAAAAKQKGRDPKGTIPDRWVNNASSVPTLPAWGILRQVRMQGLIENTTHTIKGLGKYGYPALVHTVDMTQGHGGWIKPKYIYEHDYKIKKNGYVGTDPSYSWSTNLPGAYRDTRARGLEGGDDMLDFSIGTVFTWRLEASKAYTITTQVAVKGAKAPTKSVAKLVASTVPNDGGFSLAGAIKGGGCTFKVDPTDPSLTPTRGTGDLAWCGGIGDFQHPASIKNRALIRLPDFPVVASGTCYNWVIEHGSKKC